MAKYNKKELIALVAEVKGSTKKDAEASIDAVFEAITTALGDGNDVFVSGFANFEIRDREARLGRNPQTGEEIQIEAKRTVVAKISPKVKDAVNG